jgi:hypothetical protein
VGWGGVGVTTLLSGIYPAIVRGYDRPRRQCRIEIPGITDGADALPLAECLQPLGDRTDDNEIRIKIGDRVYVQFLAGDPRHPLIVGFRAKNVENNIGRRYFEQENIETVADIDQTHSAGENYKITAGINIDTEAVEAQSHTAGTAYTIEAGEQIELKVGGSTITITSSGIIFNGTRIDLNE